MDEDVLLQKIREYKASIKMEQPAMNVALLMRVLEIVNDSCEVKFAVDPIGDDGEWISGTPTTAVAGIHMREDGRLAVTLKNEKHGMGADAMHSALKRAQKRGCAGTADIVVERGEHLAKVTDIYSHALVREKWAGLPFDVVLVACTQEHGSRACAVDAR